MLEGKEREEYICNFFGPLRFWIFELARGYTDSIMWSNYKHHILHVLKEHFLGIRLPEINRDERLFITPEAKWKWRKNTDGAQNFNGRSIPA